MCWTAGFEMKPLGDALRHLDPAYGSFVQTLGVSLGVPLNVCALNKKHGSAAHTDVNAYFMQMGGCLAEAARFLSF